LRTIWTSSLAFIISKKTTPSSSIWNSQSIILLLHSRKRLSIVFCFKVDNESFSPRQALPRSIQSKYKEKLKKNGLSKRDWRAGRRTRGSQVQ
jgi:hypothetical protein